MALRFAVLACDVVCLSVREDGSVLIRLTKTTRPLRTEKGTSLPGGLIRPNETADRGAVRLLKERGGIRNPRVYFEQLYTMSTVNRDPSGRVVSVAYLALIPWQALSPHERESADESWWENISSARHLAYDHDEIVALALKRLRAKVGYTTLIKTLLSEKFTLTELEELFENITGRNVDKRNFRRKVKGLGVLRKTSRMRRKERHRPASLWKFRKRGIEYIEIL